MPEKQKWLAPCSPQAQNELLHFLKLARPEWSVPRRSGHSDTARVLTKLRAIGITDAETLVRRIEKNQLNGDLEKAGFVGLSKEAIDSIRKQRPFLNALESVDTPHIRQVGVFSPVSQMLSTKRLNSARAPLPCPGGTQSAPNIMLQPKPPARTAGMAATFSDGFFQRGFVEDAGLFSGTCSESQSTADRPRLRGVELTGKPTKRGATSSSSSACWRGSQPETSVEPTPSASASRNMAAPPGILSPTNNRSVKSFAVTWSTQDPMGLGGSGQVDSEAVGSIPPAPTPSALSRTYSSMSRAATDRGGNSLPELPSHEEVESMHRAGLDMVRALDYGGGLAPACWAAGRARTPTQQGEDMLNEQRALEERDHLVRSVKIKAEELPFRTHIAANIKHRLSEEKRRDAEGAAAKVAIQGSVTNIRRQLLSMADARRELARNRSRLQALEEDNEENGGQAGGEDLRQALGSVFQATSKDLFANLNSDPAPSEKSSRRVSRQLNSQQNSKEPSGRRGSQVRRGGPGQPSSKERSVDEEARPSKEATQKEIDSEIVGGLRSKFQHSRTSVCVK